MEELSGQSIFNNIDKKIIAVVFIIGFLSLFVPIWYILAGIIGLIIGTYLICNPKVTYYLILFLSVFSYNVKIGSQNLPLYYTDIFITICAFGIFCQILFQNVRVDLSTKIDKWLLGLLFIHMFAGLTSEDNRGFLGSIKYTEIVAFYYITIYFIRLRILTVSEILKIMMFTAVFQALLGMLQSFTGGFGADFHSNRNLLGYLGIGSKVAWHGKGTFSHFNQFGPFMFFNVLLFAPLYLYLIKRNFNRLFTILLFLMIIGLYVSYSRGSWLGCVMGIVTLFFTLSKNKIKFLVVLSIVSLPTYFLYYLLTNSVEYLSTLSPRNLQWNIAISAISADWKSLLLGYGLRSYNIAISNFLPGNAQNINIYHAHNFILFYAVEIGTLFTTFLVAFYLYVAKVAYDFYVFSSKILKYISLSTLLIIVAFMFEGMFDHAITLFHIQLWIYALFGIIFSYNDNYKRRIICN